MGVEPHRGRALPASTRSQNPSRAPVRPRLLRGRHHLGVLDIRRYEDRAAGAVWQLHNIALQSTGVHLGNGPWADDLRSITYTYLAAGGEFLVSASGGELVAMGALRRVSDAVAEIKRMRVAPELQRRGIGRSLLGELERGARELGYRTIRLDTTVHTARRSTPLRARRLPRTQPSSWSGRSRDDFPGETHLVAVRL